MTAEILRFSDYYLPPKVGWIVPFNKEPTSIIFLPMVRIEHCGNGDDIVRIVDIPKERPFK